MIKGDVNIAINGKNHLLHTMYYYTNLRFAACPRFILSLVCIYRLHFIFFHYLSLDLSKHYQITIPLLVWNLTRLYVLSYDTCNTNYHEFGRFYEFEDEKWSLKMKSSPLAFPCITIQCRIKILVLSLLEIKIF